MKVELCSENALDYVKVALAIETLAYHNKDYLSNNLHATSAISEEVQALLTKAVALSIK